MKSPFPTVTVIDHPLVQHKLTLLREKDTSTARFRRIAREISLLMCYEVTRDLPGCCASSTASIQVGGISSDGCAEHDD